MTQEFDELRSYIKEDEGSIVSLVDHGNADKVQQVCLHQIATSMVEIEKALKRMEKQMERRKL